MHIIREVMGYHSIDYTRNQYAKFSPESPSRAVLRILEGNQSGTNHKYQGHRISYPNSKRLNRLRPYAMLAPFSI
jgi:hypothetical protein